MVIETKQSVPWGTSALELKSRPPIPTSLRKMAAPMKSEQITTVGNETQLYLTKLVNMKGKSKQNIKNADINAIIRPTVL